LATSSINVPNASPLPARVLSIQAVDGDEIARLITFLFAATVDTHLRALVFELWIGSTLPRKVRTQFFVTRIWTPSPKILALCRLLRHPGDRGVALFLAVPLGIGAAIFLAELARQRFQIACNSSSTCWRGASVIYGLLGVFSWFDHARMDSASVESTLGFLPLFQGRLTALVF